MNAKHMTACGVLIVVGIAVAGCGKPTEKTPTAAAPAKVAANEGRSHDGWWCNEHGVPEDVCADADGPLDDGFGRVADRGPGPDVLDHDPVHGRLSTPDGGQWTRRKSATERARSGTRSRCP